MKDAKKDLKTLKNNEKSIIFLIKNSNFVSCIILNFITEPNHELFTSRSTRPSPISMKFGTIFYASINKKLLLYY